MARRSNLTISQDYDKQKPAMQRILKVIHLAGLATLLGGLLNRLVGGVGAEHRARQRLRLCTPRAWQ